MTTSILVWGVRADRRGRVRHGGVIGGLASVNTTDESLEDWMRRLTGSVGDALMEELRRMFG